MTDNNRNAPNKSSAIIAFEFGDTAVTAFERNGDAWFVAGEVATALGYAKPRNAIAEHCKAAEICKGPELRRLGIPCSSPRGMSIIPERDLYRLVMRSKLPAAEQFEEKVVAEILPASPSTAAAVSSRCFMVILPLRIARSIRSESVDNLTRLEISGDVKAGSISLKQHTHGGVQSGGSKTAPPE